MTNSDHGERKVLAHHHSTTGKIKQVVRCYERDVEKQPVVTDHEYLDVTETNPDIHPDLHQIDIATKKVVPKVPVLEEVQRRALIFLGHAHEVEQATGPDLGELAAAAFLGGQPERDALNAAMAARRVRTQKLTQLTTQINNTQKPADVANIKWGDK